MGRKEIRATAVTSPHSGLTPQNNLAKSADAMIIASEFRRIPKHEQFQVSNKSRVLKTDSCEITQRISDFCS